ncbi:Zinc finger, C2H2 [Niveomyces insectorum RCEF 264]|uniref:Zinc finger, C2H2 n=1 Tax=Niveomyces insectorum RCEF 264 TaxID=1081102 RepID=A0A167UVL1_9HYPO|nr:Zinc finger, C2H2 [Niveomyces insectorum RCEF 264]
MDPPSKRRRLAPKLPDPPPPPLPPPPPAPATGPASAPALPAAHAATPLSDQVNDLRRGQDITARRQWSVHSNMTTSSHLPISPAAHDAAAPPAPSVLSVPSERQDFEVFAKHLQDAAMYIYRQGQKLPYARVSALLLKWDEDVGRGGGHIASLEHVLRDRYNFHTERWNIPAVANPSAKLSVRIADFVNQAGADHLLIIYYVGHGYIGSDNQLYWACHTREDSPKLKWDSVRYLLEDAQSDMLILLDSCASTDMPVAGSHGTKQVIAAFTPETMPREPDTSAFNFYLTETLHKLGNGRPFNAQRLYDELVAVQRRQERQYRGSNPNKHPPSESPAPVFFTLTPGQSRSIDLAPMPRNHPSPSLQNGGTGAGVSVGADGKVTHGSVPGPDRDAPVISPAAVADMVFDEARVLVCTTFVGDAGPDMACFNQWIADTPSLANKVAVEGMFLGPPTVLLISIPQSLWSIIQHDKICFSLGYVNSRNLIHLYDGLMKAATTSSTPRPSPGMYVSAKDVEDGRTLLEAREAAAANHSNNSHSNSNNINNNSSPTHRADFHSPPYLHQQRQQPPLQPYQQPPPPPPPLLLPQPQQATQQALLLPTPPPRHHTQPFPAPLYNSDTNSSGQYDPNTVPRRDSLPQLQQHPHQPGTTPPRGAPLPRIVSRASSPTIMALAKDESEESAEMKEAAEQLKALSYVRPIHHGNASPSDAATMAANSNHLSKIAQDVIKRQEGDPAAAEDTEMKTDDGTVSPTKKAKPKKEYRFKPTRSHDGQAASPRSRAQPDAAQAAAQALPSLLPQGAKQEVQCDYCTHEPFKDSSSLKKHIASAHTRPFPCAFAFAGCNSTFGSKNEWKRHIASQHLCLQYYRCSSCSQNVIDGKGNEFNRKDLFTQHLRRMHAPPYIRKSTQKRDSKVETEWEDFVKGMQKSCCIVRRLPPQRSACPKPGCNRLFEGRSAWDEWTEHVGRHMENGEGELLGVDDLLVSWSLEEGIIVRTDDGGYRLCNPMGNGGGGGGSGSNSGGTNGSTNHGRQHHGSNTNNEDGAKSKNVSNISVSTTFTTDATAASGAERADKIALPPTPPPTTTRPHNEEHEDAGDGAKTDTPQPEYEKKEKWAGDGVKTEVTHGSEKDEAQKNGQKAESPGTEQQNQKTTEPTETAARSDEEQRNDRDAKGDIGILDAEQQPQQPPSEEKNAHSDKPATAPEKADLQSITVAATAIAAVAALQQEKEASRAAGAMEVDG